MNIIVTNGYIPAHSEEHAEKLLRDIREAGKAINSSPAEQSRFDAMMAAMLKEHDDAAAKWEAGEAALEKPRKNQPPRTVRSLAAATA